MRGGGTFVTKYYYDEQIKEDKMCRNCNMHECALPMIRVITRHHLISFYTLQPWRRR